MIDSEHRNRGVYRAGPDRGDFREHLPGKPSLIEILTALRDRWGLEPRMMGERVGVEASRETPEGATRMRQFRYDPPGLEVDPKTGIARWVISCRLEDAIHIDEFTGSREGWELIQVGPAVQSPLRGLYVPPFAGSGSEHGETWWSHGDDIDILRQAVERMRIANADVRQLLEMEEA
jgi:hypothetical protein